MEEFKQSLAQGEHAIHEGLCFRGLFKAHINTQTQN